MLSRQLDFQQHNLDFDHLGLSDDVLALTAFNAPQFQVSPPDLFTPNFVSTGENFTTGPQHNVPQMQAPRPDSIIPNFVTTPNNLTTGPQFIPISDMPLTLPPPPTLPQTPRATDVHLPAVPDEATGPEGPDLDVAVPPPPNRRRRIRTSAVNEDAQQMPPVEETRQRCARNIAFNRRELDNAIGTSSARPRVVPNSKRGHDNDTGSSKYVLAISFMFNSLIDLFFRRRKRG